MIQVRGLIQKLDRREAAPLLRTLSPRFEQDEHGYYADALFAQLVRVGADAPRNIALTGHYGSGKSSVLVEVEARLNARRRLLRRQRGRAVNVSLSSLGTDEPPAGRIADDGAPPALTNLIQKEIVKQLLYRARPSRMRGSRFRRLDVFHPVPAAVWAVTLTAAAAGIGLLFGLLDRVTRVLPSSWASETSWAPWAALGIAVLVIATLGWSAGRALHSRVRIGDASAGPVKVSLKEETSSFFDAYLDELVYFFQASQTSVVIFEDLDRFKDPHIFESLRELNTILSNAEQIRYRPVRFVYAIKDSIFEAITDSDPPAPSTGPTPAEPAQADSTRRAASPPPDASTTLVPSPPRSTGDPMRREATRNRTKFFDVVIPIVPFISHRNARDLARREFADTGVDHDLLDLIAPHLTDMRLLRNIRNEYDVFAAKILPPHGPEGLGKNQLLAMTVYKNLHLTDYEAIREGESNLDDLYQKYRDLVATASTAARQDAERARGRLNALAAGPARAADLGERLIAIADLTAATRGPSSGVQVGSNQYGRDQLASTAFWRDWAESGEDLLLHDRYRHQTSRISRATVSPLLGVTLDVERWDDQSRSDLERREREARDRAEWIERASLQDVLADATLLTPVGQTEVPLRTLAEEKLDALTFAMVERGYLLDENYTLYVARFHVGKLSLRAMNFILHSVQPNRRDVRFQFLDVANIDAVIEEEGDRLLAGEAVFNLEVFDHLLPTATQRLEPAITRLADGSTGSIKFLDAYLTRDGRADELIRLLAPQWSGVFTYLAGEGRLRPDVALHLSDVAAQAASASTAYEMSPEARSVLQQLTARGAVFVDYSTTRDLAALTRLLKGADVDVADLRPLTDDVRAEIVRQNLYPIAPANLRAAIDDDIIDLNTLFDTDPVVYTHVRSHLETYLDDAESDRRFSLTDGGQWRPVLEDLATHRSDMLQAVVESSAPGVHVSSLEEIDASTWPVLARCGRFKATASNVARYVAEYAPDEDLAAFLTRAHDEVTPDLVAPENGQLARALVNSALLPPDRLVPLVQSLGVAPFTLEDLTATAAPAVPCLVAVGLLPDDAAAYEFLRDHPWTLRRELVMASDSFAERLGELDLDPEEFRALALDGDIAAAVKKGLLQELARFQGHLDAPSAKALARWASDRQHVASVADLVLLARSGAEPADVFAALASQVAGLGWDEIAALLEGLGAPFRDLTVTGDQRWLYLPASDGLRSLLDRMRALGRITSYDERESSGELVVRRKRNPSQ